MSFQCHYSADPGDVHERVDVSLISGTQLDVIHVEELTMVAQLWNWYLLPLYEITWLGWGVQAYAEQQGPRLIVTCAICFVLASRVVFHNPIVFSMKTLVILT